MVFSDTIQGALIALGGVLLTQISVYLTEWIKSSREWQKSLREKQITLKRDLYLPIIEALTEVQSFFISIPPAHYSKLSELKLSETAQKSLAAQSLIANERIMIVINNVSKHIAEGTMRLLALKLDEAKLAIELDHLITRINELLGNNRLILDRMKELREAGNITPEIASSLDEQFQRNQSEYQELYAEQQEKFVRRNDMTKEMYLQMMRELGKFALLTVPVIVEFRRDLEIPTNAEAILNHTKESIKFVDEALPGYVEEIFQKATEETSGYVTQ